ncbi:hypothetical protein JHK85_053762 [Glycine max]|nr:hypothetical protein JHK85_053762 [Glycine max]
MLREAYTIQANCCDDLESKVHDLRIVLDDWIRFRKCASGDNALDKMDLRWPQNDRSDEISHSPTQLIYSQEALT